MGIGSRPVVVFIKKKERKNVKSLLKLILQTERRVNFDDEKHTTFRV